MEDQFLWVRAKRRHYVGPWRLARSQSDRRRDRHDEGTYNERGTT